MLVLVAQFLLKLVIMKRILLADNQDISKLGWQHIIAQFSDEYIVIEADHKKELVESLVIDSNSLVILDYTLFDFESVDELINIGARFPQTFWLLFSDALSDQFLRTVLLNTFTFGVIMKDSSFDEIKMALKESLKGNRYICSHVSNILLDNSRKAELKLPKNLLTITEQEILKEMAMGKTSKEIASKRFVSVHTIMTHRKNIFRKIEVNTIYEATKYALRAGIVDTPEYYI